MIDEVLHADSSQILATKKTKVSDFFIAGHFPGAHVVPGAMMQEMTTQAAGILLAEFYSPVPDYDSSITKGHALGVLRSVQKAKYKSFVRPEQTLLITVKLIDQLESSFRFKGEIKVDSKVVMMNEFTLINISDEKILDEKC